MRQIAKKNILLIEDEVHKREELSGYLAEFIATEKSIHVVESVRQAILAVETNDYDLLILDMALPTFTVDGDVLDSGIDQALGGVEVLRALKSIGKQATIIIVTQYPDVSLSGKRVKLKAAQVEWSKKYGQNIKGAVLYKYKSASNRQKLRKLLGDLW